MRIEYCALAEIFSMQFLTVWSLAERQYECRLTAHGTWVRCQPGSVVADCTDKPDGPHVAGEPQGVGEYRVYPYKTIVTDMESEGSLVLHWYALKVYFNKVTDMRDLLEGDGVEGYVPYLAQPSHGRDKGKRPEQAVPSLMFFRSSVPYARKFQQRVRGRAMVYTRQSGSGWVPAPIADREMSIFRLVVSSGTEGLEYLDSDPRVFQRGERVRVTGGVFAGAEGYIARIKGDRRLIVTLTGVCAVATSYIPQCFLEKIEED